jgi:hypothetical protein
VDRRAELAVLTVSYSVTSGHSLIHTCKSPGQKPGFCISTRPRWRLTGGALSNAGEPLAENSKTTARPEASARRVQDLAMTVLVYVNTCKQVGDAEHVKVFATTAAAETWFEENDPESVAFEYEVLEWSRQLRRPYFF